MKMILRTKNFYSEDDWVKMLGCKSKTSNNFKQYLLIR